MRPILFMFLITVSTILFGQDRQTMHDAHDTVPLDTIHIVSYVVDVMAPAKNNCSYNRPKPSFNIICQPHNTPIFHILSWVPEDTITLKKGEPFILTIYPDYHPDIFAWYDRKDAVEVTLTIYDYQGHETLRQHFSTPTNQFPLPTSFTSGKCTVEEWHHTRKWMWARVWEFEQ
jgi:hypothetical protein